MVGFNTTKYFTKYFIIKPKDSLEKFDIEITDSSGYILKREYGCTIENGYYILIPYCIIKDADISKERSGVGYIESMDKSFKIKCYENLKNTPIEFYYKEGL